ncbi:MAG: ComEA family DNA-binding protein [Rhodococcus sp. (in: high G+C Gram-positive bacteria)]
MVPRTRPISRTGSGRERSLLERHEDSAEWDDRTDSGERSDRAPAYDWLEPDGGRDTALSAYLPERWRTARLDPGRGGMLALCAVGVVVVLVAGYAMVRDAPSAAPVPALPVVQPESSSQDTRSQDTRSPTTPSLEPPSHIVVSVVGLVATSGLVHLPAGSRVADALAAAGGPLGGADVLALNLAAKVEDGEQIVVGATPPEGRPIVSGTVQDGGGGATDTAAQHRDPATESGGVDLNTATVAELDALSGVGPVTAANIVAWRETNGSFSNVEQLAEVDGIGPARLEKLRGQVTV